MATDPARAELTRPGHHRPVARPAAPPLAARRIPVIVNTAAGTSPVIDSLDRLRLLFATAGMASEIVEVRTQQDIVRAVHLARMREPPMIVAAGGDGTISAVAAEIAGSGTPLGILPLGTLNHFARDLGIPADIEGAIGVLAQGVLRAVDVGDVNGRVFVNNSSIGLYPRLVHVRERIQQRLGRGKWSALVRATLTVLHRFPVVDVRVETRKVSLARRTPLVFVGNTVYAMHGLDIGRRARLDAGTLCLYTPRRAGRAALLRIALRALLGRLARDDEFDSIEADEIRISTRRRHVRLAVDGETMAALTPLVYRVRRAALSVVVPRPEPGDAS
jgi:diacylglycerol kinase family enzyme